MTMTRFLWPVFLALLLLAGGGIVVAQDHGESPGPSTGRTISQFALLALIEAHEPGADVSFEHHSVCADCTGFATVVGLEMALVLAYLLTGGPSWSPRAPLAFSAVAFSPPAPPPR